MSRLERTIEQLGIAAAGFLQTDDAVIVRKFKLYMYSPSKQRRVIAVADRLTHMVRCRHRNRKRTDQAAACNICCCFSLQVTAELFNILSGQSDVDHPLCEVRCSLSF